MRARTDKTVFLMVKNSHFISHAFTHLYFISFSCSSYYFSYTKTDWQLRVAVDSFMISYYTC